METKHLTYFKVENFKRFDSLEVKDIGQFNLVVGDNNVGKTSFLEALLFDDEDYNKCQRNLWGPLSWKNMNLNGVNVNYLTFFLNKKNLPITYFFSFNKDQQQLTIKPRLRMELTKEETEKIATQLILNGQANHLIEFKSNFRTELLFVSNFLGVEYIPFISFNMSYNEDLVGFFSEISIETNNFKRIESDLKLFIPNLESIEINNAFIPQHPVIALREKGKDLIPLAQYGDGTIKLLRYLLELEKCTGGRLMIDEIDAGMHYSRMKDFLMKVLLTANNKNVQIFATTHSKECLEYYKQALEELGLQDSGRVIKIADTKSGIKSFTFNFEQFDNALSAGSEIR